MKFQESTEREIKDIQPTILCDTREQDRLKFSVPSELATLATGDYTLKGLENEIVFERKSLADFIMCCGTERDRFMRECHRMQAYLWRRIIVIGSREDIVAHNYRSQMSPASILATITVIEIRYNIPIIFVKSQEEASATVENYARYYLRERLKTLQAIVDTQKPPSERAKAVLSV